jgi:hypothetical protein
LNTSSFNPVLKVQNRLNITKKERTMKPCIVIVGLDKIFLDEVVEGLTGENKINDNNLIEWTIDTKYYTADVHVCPVNNKMLVEESVANSAQVLILLLDPSQVYSSFFCFLNLQIII